MSRIKNKLKALHNSIIEKRNSSILIMAGGSSFQILTWLISFAIIGNNNNSMWLLFPVTAVIMLTPFISIYGIAVAIIQIRKKHSIILPIIGIFFNMVWLLWHIMFCLIAFKYGAAI